MPRLSKIGAAALAAFGWTSGSSVTADFLVIAGGGGGGTNAGGGGGAGGYRCSVTGESSGGGASAEAKLSLNPTLSYTVTVGAGGTSGAGAGGNSTISTITSTGGGGGGNFAAIGNNGGSGGGDSSFQSTGGSGTANQGFNGGRGQSAGGTIYPTGGGGGAGALGADGTAGGASGNGGNGVASSISGSSVTRAGGGGGGSYSNTAGSGGSGGGGNGATNANTGVNGTANLGAGGGGGGTNSGAGGQGGSGIVIISYVGAQQFGGGVVTSSGGNTIHTFTTSGTLSPLNSLTASYLIVAGGGAGGGQVGGGGGAGGYLAGSGITIDTNSIYAVTVGAGGTGTAFSGTNGTNSTFSMVSTAAVGGGGGGSSNTATIPGNGGSGGGGGGFGTAIGTGTVGQGNNGGTSIGAGAPNYPGGGGGGSFTVGGNATATVAGVGGTGTPLSISGTSVTYAAGASGGLYNVGSSNGVAGTANTGNGGSGSSTGSGGAGEVGGAGGSGIVIISYPGSTQQMAGGTVTVAGGNVIHTFTSSGYLTPIVLVNNSLRFRASASAYLDRTFPSAGNRKTYTLSLWVKRGILGGSANQFFFSSGVSTTAGGFYFTPTDNIEVNPRVNNTNTFLTTTQVFRDPSAWYHIVFALDTTQATDSNRMKLYVNGVQVTAFSTAVYPAFDGVSTLNNNIAHWIGRYPEPGFPSPFDGYLAEYNFIDGQALTPNSFGSFNGLGVWQPIRYGGSYGTNGFYLPFNASTSSTFAGSFNASNQSLSTPNASQFALGSSDFTVEAWVYLTNSSVSTSNNVLNQSDSNAGSNSAFFFGVGSNGVALYLSTTGTSWTNFISGGNVLPQQNRWYHIVWQRSGNTLQTFVNGVLSNSGTFSGTVNTSTRNIEIGCQNNAGAFFGGYISNVRLVKGVAVYTNGFTPPTANLGATQSAGANISAITGTQTSYLTLQNSSIVDNSTFAVTITNNNSVATSAQYPFVTQAFNDQSPAGNNWTPNNIGGLNGSSYDFMTDAPTLTSTMAANYATFNPIIPSTTNLINGNLTRNSSVRTNVSTFPAIGGKYYFETTIQDSNGNGGVGVKQTTAYPLQDYDTSKCATYFANGEYKIEGASQTSGFSSYTNGDVIGCAVDSTVSPSKIWWSKNGTWQGTGNPTTAGYSLTAGLDYYFMVLHGSGSSSTTASVNFGQQPFAYTIPSGFTALNTYNL